MKPFSLIIWAIVAIALLITTITLFQNFFPQRNINSELNDALVQAESNYGKLIRLEDIYVLKDKIISKKTFEKYERSVAIECTSSTICCPLGEECKKIEWKYTYLKFNKPMTTTFYVRCLDKEITVCRIYAGLEPAIAKHVSLLKHVNGTQLILEQKVINSGKTTLTEGITKAEIEKKINEEWIPTGREIEKQFLKKLEPEMEHTFIWDIEITNPGEYRVKTIFYSDNSGKDINYIDFNISPNSGCRINKNKVQTIKYQENNTIYREIHSCDNCNHAYECLAKWMEAYPGTEWNIMDKEKAYCEKETKNKSCLD